MELDQEEQIESRLNLIAKIALYFQSTAIGFVALIVFLKPAHYQEIGQVFSATALVLSFFISKAYIFTGKLLEEQKSLSPEDKAFRKKEYLYKFFSAYPIWMCGIFLFSM